MNGESDSGGQRDAVIWLFPNFPRLLDLYEQSERNNPANYFNVEFPLPLSEEEKRLQKLDLPSWKILRDKAAPYVSIDNPLRHYQQLWSVLDEARGYVFLADDGYERIEFIEPDKSKKGGKQSPDLIGFKANSAAILEVKTINESNDNLAPNAPWRNEAVTVPHHLSEAFKRKVITTLEQASGQLLSFPRQVNRKIVLLIVRFDYGLKTSGDLYKELDQFIKSLTPDAGVEVYHQPTLG